MCSAAGSGKSVSGNSAGGKSEQRSFAEHPPGRSKKLSHILFDVVIRREAGIPGGRGREEENNCASGCFRRSNHRFTPPVGFPHQSLDPVPVHGPTKETARRHTKLHLRFPHSRSPVRRQDITSEKFTFDSPAMFEDLAEALFPAYDLRFLERQRSSLTVSFHRPFALLRARTLRPSLDFILSRNPCLFFRFRMLG